MRFANEEITKHTEKIMNDLRHSDGMTLNEAGYVEVDEAVNKRKLGRRDASGISGLYRMPACRSLNSANQFSNNTRHVGG